MVTFVSVASYASLLSEVNPDHVITGLLPLGSVQQLDQRSVSFRFGSDTPLVYSLSCGDSNIELSGPVTGSLAANGMTGTITARLSTDLDSKPQDYSPSISVQTDGYEIASLEIPYTILPPAEQWNSGVGFERTGAVSDLVLEAIKRVASPIRLYRFDPVAYRTPEPSGAIRYGRTDANGRLVANVQGGDICQRLNPLDTAYGYRMSYFTIGATFQSENESVTTDYEATSAETTYTASANLYIPAALNLSEHFGYVDMSRTYALFQSGNDLQPDQYKRTIWLVQHYGRVLEIQHVYALQLARELTHYEAELREVRAPHMGAPSFYNPFAIVYTYNNEKPYAAYPCYQGLAQLVQGFSVDSQDPYA